MAAVTSRLQRPNGTFKTNYPPKTNMEPENHPFEQENHLLNIHLSSVQNPYDIANVILIGYFIGILTLAYYNPIKSPYKWVV